MSVSFHTVTNSVRELNVWLLGYDIVELADVAMYMERKKSSVKTNMTTTREKNTLSEFSELFSTSESLSPLSLLFDRSWY